MKFTALALFTVAACPSIAQTLTQGEQYVQDAMGQLRQKNTLLLRMRGYDSYGKKQVGLATDLYWDVQNPGTATEKARLELNEFRDGLQVTRSVGDGTQLWNYDLSKNEYSVARYGSYGAAQPESYINDLVQSLAAVTKGQNIYSVRLLREVYPGNQAVYRPWMPGAVETVIDDVGESAQDPVIADRTYTATDTHMFVLYSYRTAPQRSLCFELFRGTTSDPWSLGVIFLGDVSSYKGSQRVINLSVEVLPDPTPGGTFTFVPPRSAKSVAAPKPPSGG